MSSYDEQAITGHRYYRGKTSTGFKVPISSYRDFAIWYTPGVAAPCVEIAKETARVFEYTNKGNSIAVVSDGSRVLGLGNIGPQAALPVMEGKALLFKYLGDVDATPIVLDTQDTDEIITAVKRIAPTYGGINLEDISSPKCFRIYETLATELAIPVFHDDQQGTAVVALAGLLNALKVVEKPLHEVAITIVGAGAAGRAFAKLLMATDVDAGKMKIVDSKGILHVGREDFRPWKLDLAQTTNREAVEGDTAKALEGADVAVCLARPGPGVLTSTMIEGMTENAIVFALANPTPEITPEEARKGGARIVATGRSDYPNQVNNSLGFPAIFRGMLDVRATAINVEMMLAAAEALATCAEEKGLTPDYIIPSMDEAHLYPREAVAVAEAAMASGVARITVDVDELRVKTEDRLRTTARFMQVAMREGLIRGFPS